jgi:hypothetical protein
MSLFTVIPYGKNVGGNSSATAGSNTVDFSSQRAYLPHKPIGYLYGHF